jgi:hypothetical protein
VGGVPFTIPREELPMKTHALLATAALLAAVAAASPLPAAAKRAASRPVVLDNDRDCRADPEEPTELLGEVTATQQEQRKLRLAAYFDMWGGKEEVAYHLEIAVHPNRTDTCYGGRPTQAIPGSSFRTDAVGIGGTTVTIRDPRAPFHIYICSDDGADCSFAGNFVYRGKRISADDPG